MKPNVGYKKKKLTTASALSAVLNRGLSAAVHVPKSA